MFGISATTAMALGSSALGAYSAYKGSKQSGNQTTTQQQQLDPRIADIVFGKSGSTGLLGQYQGMLGTPQNSGIAAYGHGQDGYLAQTADDDFNKIRAAALNQIGLPPQAPTMQAAQVAAPAQNGLNLTGSYKSLIDGPAGANPYLTGAIQKGINQSTNAFQGMQDSATRNLMQTIMPSIRSNSVLAGQYGGSRQGVAEGNAIGDFARAQQQAASQFGQNNTDAAVSAQAGAYDADRNRQLAATQGLGSQQYGVASQNAAMQQAAGQANMGSQLQTQGLKLNTEQTGVNNLKDLMGSAYTVAQNQDGYALNQAGKVNGLLTPYLSANSSSTTSQPLYENKGGNMLGGALMGGQLAGMFGGGSTVANGQFKGSQWGGIADLFSKNYMNY